MVLNDLVDSFCYRLQSEKCGTERDIPYANLLNLMFHLLTVQDVSM